MKHVAIYNDWIKQHATYSATRVGLVDDAKSVSRTYLEIDRRVDALAERLQTVFGVASGDRVVLVSKSCIEAFELQFACARIGAIFVPTNWRLSAEELGWIIQDCDPRVVFFDTEFSSICPDDRPRVEVALDASPDSPYEQLARANTRTAPARVEWENTWMILYTSGTTGRPKGAMLSYRMMHLNAVSWLSPSRIGARSVFLCSMPTFHTGGLNCYSNSVLYAGGTVIVQRDYDPKRALEILSDPVRRVSHFFGTPTHYSLLTQVQGFSDTPLPALEIAGMGGSPSSNALVKDLMQSGLPMQPAYGMTEIGPAIFVTEMHDVQRKIGSCGHPTMHVEMKIVDVDGATCQTGEAGELWVRGPVCMTGYWNKPEATRDAFVEGWFKTGDGAKIDEDGYVYIVDRLKDMFISGGENVYPAEIERVLGDHPSVLLAAVVGVPDERWGEVGAAYVVLKAGASVTGTALLEHCAQRLARYKIPKTLEIRDDLPRNASGKILKRAIRKPPL